MTFSYRECNSLHAPVEKTSLVKQIKQTSLFLVSLRMQYIDINNHQNAKRVLCVFVLMSSKSVHQTHMCALMINRWRDLWIACYAA